MNANATKERSFYTQGQQYVGGILLLFIVCLFTSCNTGTPGGPTEHGEATVRPGASISTPDQAQVEEQQGSKPPLVEQPRSLASNPQIDQQPEKLSELAGGPTEHGEATVRPGASISTPDQARVGEQQESDPPLVKELRALASDLEIDQQPDKLAELGAVLLKLAASKQEAGVSTQDLSLYTEAAILYQHVLSICEKHAQEQEKLADVAYQGLAQIESSMLAQATGAATQADAKALRDRIAEDKQRLEAIRTKAREEAKRLAEFRDQQGSTEEVRGAEAVYIEGSKKLFADIAGYIKFLLGNFYQAGEEELKAAGITCPCHYAIMGVGSIALQQTTPYSDLEFAILMEDVPNEDEATAEEWRAYFRTLTHLVHFRVINLGETVIPKDQYGVSLDHLGKRGLNFDLGGKTPLGRKDKDYELIQPVTKMAEYMQNEGGKMEQMDKLLPYILESTCHIYGDSSLHKAYEDTQASFLKRQAASGKREYQKRIAKKLLQGTADRSRQQPGDIPSHRPIDPIDAGKPYNVKEEIYRLPDRLLYGLALYYGILPQSGWDAVDQLLKDGKINETGAHHLKYMASFASMLRLETYLHHRQQNEQLSLRGGLSPGGAEERSSQAVHESFLQILTPAALKEGGSLFRYYYTALPFHEYMEEFFELLNLRQEVRRKKVVDKSLQEILFGIAGKFAAPQEGTYFQSEPFCDTSCATKLGIYNRLLEYESAKKCAEEQWQKVKAQHFYNAKKVARYHNNLAIALYNLGRLVKSLAHFTCALELLEGVNPKGYAEVSYMLKVLRNMGIYHYNQKDYSSSLPYFTKCLEILQAFYQDDHPETSQILLSLGEVHAALGDFPQSFKHKKQAVEMLESLYGSSHPEVGQASLSLSASYKLTQREEGSPQTIGPSLPPVRVVHPQYLTLLPTPRHGKEPEGENALLRKYYQQANFVCVKSLIFEKQSSKHVKDLECQLMLLEQKLAGQEKEGAKVPENHISQHHERRFEWVKTPLGSEDLFKKRSIRPGEPEKEVWRILLTGDPGTGKTTLSKKLAYQWSVGEWGQGFEAVYLLPVRKLLESTYDDVRYNSKKTLATAIVNICFTHPPSDEDEYKQLRKHIEKELQKPTTLVILDGLDERAGASEQIISQAQDQSAPHKLLMLSRPYDIEEARRLAEIEIEHVGFNRAQLERYVRQEVSGKQVVGLLDYIRKHENIRTIAHVPVNLQILCALWQDQTDGVQEELDQGSLPSLYRQFINYIWYRYKGRLGKEQLQHQDKEHLFNTLGKVALQALEEGKVLISPILIDKILGADMDARASQQAFKDAGFFLLQYVGEDAGKQEGFYEFPHLTFQEYFAGRALAHQFLSKDEDEREEANDFLSEHKYKRQYGRTLTFMAGEVSRRTKGVKDIKELLRLLGESDQELVGLQHLLLQLRVVHEWLCVATKREADKGMDELEEQFQVRSSLGQWFERAFAHVRLEGYGHNSTGRKLLELLTGSLQTFGSVARHAPDLFELLKKEAEDQSDNVRQAALKALSSLVQASPAMAQEALPSILDTLKDEDSDVCQAAQEALSSLLQASPAMAQEALPIILAAAKDKAWEVRQAALKALSSLLQASPAMAQEFLPSILKATKDKNSDVRRAALKALSTLLQAYPSQAQEALPCIMKAIKDEDSDVRQAALEALSSLLQASPGQVQEAFPIILAAAKDKDSEDEDSGVRQAALEALSSLLEASPALAPRSLANHSSRLLRMKIPMFAKLP